MYRVAEIGEADLQDQLNIIAAEGWVLVSCMVHSLATTEGRPIFVTIWSR